MNAPINTNTLLDIAAVLSLVITGVFALISIFDKSTNMRRKEKDTLDEQLITGLKDRINLLEDTLQKTVDELKIMKDEFVGVTAKNQTLTDLLQGRSKSDKEYRKKSLESMEKGDQILELVRETNTTNQKILTSIEKLYKVIENHLLRIEGGGIDNGEKTT